jgi:hypothetical protein
MTPNNRQSTVKPLQRIIVDLPFNSTVDLSIFTWLYKGETTHLGVAANGISTTTPASGSTAAIPGYEFCGIVTIEIVLAPASMLIEGIKPNNC